MHIFLSIIILYKYQIFFFFFLKYSQTVFLRYLIVNLVKFASSSFVHGCSKVRKIEY